MINERGEALKRKLSKLLVGFTRNFPISLDASDMSRTRPSDDEFPVPALILFVLRNAMGFYATGPEEKVAWTVYFNVKEVPFAVQLQKSGFMIRTQGGSKADVDRVCGQLKRAQKSVEGYLRPIAMLQARHGNVTIANRFSQFDGRYRFFRDSAKEAYARAAKKPGRPKDIPEDATADEKIALAMSEMTASWNAKVRAEREGFYFSIAMIDAYFSRLEHELALMRAFVGKPLAEGELLDFFSAKAKWDEKVGMFLDVGGNHRAGLALGKLKRIKERIRNPFAHGGVENDHGSLFVHLPSLGTVPANFTRHKDSVQFNFVPVGPDDFKEACAAFDAFDSLLSAGPLAGVRQMIDAGIDPQFDAETLTVYKSLVSGIAEAREAYIDRWGDAWMRQSNMDF